MTTSKRHCLFDSIMIIIILTFHCWNLLFCYCCWTTSVDAFHHPHPHPRPHPHGILSKQQILKIVDHVEYLSFCSLSLSKNDNDENEKESESRIQKNDDASYNLQLLQDLEQSFDYQGRLPTKLSLPNNTNFRCGFVSILGAPNMGKSTLLNALLEQTLCIATKRPQTTRHAILGIITTQDAQLILIDTPGIIEAPAYKLQEGMMEAVMGAFYDSDVLLVVTDLYSTPIPDDTIFEKVQKSKLPVIVVINKVDLVGKANPPSSNQPKQQQDDTEMNAVDDTVNEFIVEEETQKTYTVTDAVAKWRSLLPNALAIIPVSASEGSNNPGVVLLRKLLLGGDDIPSAIRDLGRPTPGMFRPGVLFLTDNEAKSLLPMGPPLYDEEMLTDRPERFFASELIREALFETLKKELPYCCEVRIDEFKEPKPKDPKPMNRIKATVFVERDSQKVIVIGKGGIQIKKVGMLAREKIENFLQEKVFLELTVKVNKDWRKNEDQLKNFGYVKR